MRISELSFPDLLSPANEVWGKVIFSQVSVCPRGGGGMWQTPRWVDTPPGQRETANEAGGTHPTGMHSCCLMNSISYTQELMRRWIREKCNEMLRTRTQEPDTAMYKKVWVGQIPIQAVLKIRIFIPKAYSNLT